MGDLTLVATSVLRLTSFCHATLESNKQRDGSGSETEILSSRATTRWQWGGASLQIRSQVSSDVQPWRGLGASKSAEARDKHSCVACLQPHHVRTEASQPEDAATEAWP